MVIVEQIVIFSKHHAASYKILESGQNITLSIF